MITEMITFQLRADASLTDASSPASKVIRDLLAPELATHGGHHVYYGQFIEKPETGIILLEWDSIDEQKKFMSSPNYEAHANQLREIVEDEKSIIALHVPFNSSDDPSPALGANSKVGATEVVFFYFPSTLTRSDTDGIMSSIDKMRPALDRFEALGVYDGWALEDAVPNPGPQASEGEKSKVWVSVVGWVDVDAHMRFQDSEDFQKNLHLLLGIKELRHTEVFHVKLHAV